MRLVTRADFDGIVCGALITLEASLFYSTGCYLLGDHDVDSLYELQ